MKSPTTVRCLSLGVVGLLLAGCGATSEPPADAPAAAEPQEQITLTDARGEEVVLDGPAERIAVTEWNAAEYAVSLGVQPVGVADVTGFETWDDAVTLDAGVTDIGTRGEPSIDTVAGLGLDLMFVTDSLVGNALEQVERTTPVVVLPGGDAEDPVGTMWANMELVARATGTEERLAEVREEYDAKVEQTASAVEESGIGEEPVAFSDAYEASGQVSVRPYGPGSLLGGVLEEVGVTNAWTSVDGVEFDPAYGLSQTDVEGADQPSRGHALLVHRQRHRRWRPVRGDPRHQPGVDRAALRGGRQGAPLPGLDLDVRWSGLDDAVPRRGAGRARRDRLIAP